MDEAAWIRQAQAGDREAFSALVRLHQARLRSLVALSIPSRDDVHDLVQEAFLDAWRALPRFEAGREFGPWLRSICRNRVRGFLRDRLPKRRRELALVDEALISTAGGDGDGDGDGDGALMEARLAALRRCLEGLDDPSRRLLHLRYHDEVAVQEIAGAMGRSANGVSMMLLRLKAGLLKCVESRLHGAPL